jgi:acyl-CoA hydrolase
MADPSRQERIDRSETRMVKAVIPNTTNHYDTLFGGTLLSWMDEVAFVTATRYARLPVVTVSIDRTDFKHAIPAGTIVELVGRVDSVGRTSIKVRVEVFAENMYEGHRSRAVTGLFTMVAIDENKRPVEVPG